MSLENKTSHVELTELQKWETINDCYSFEALHFAVEKISDKDGNIGSLSNTWHYSTMQTRLQSVMRGEDPKLLTRAYGLRRQATALLHSYSFVNPR